jgi:hypothetical protein
MRSQRGAFWHKFAAKAAPTGYLLTLVGAALAANIRAKKSPALKPGESGGKVLLAPEEKSFNATLTS